MLKMKQMVLSSKEMDKVLHLVLHSGNNTDYPTNSRRCSAVKRITRIGYPYCSTEKIQRKTPVFKVELTKGALSWGTLKPTQKPEQFDHVQVEVLDQTIDV